MKKILFTAVLIFCFLTTTQTAYAYLEDDKVTVLEANEDYYVLTPQLVNQKENLIPLGAVLGENDTYYYTFKYQVIIEEDVFLASDIINTVWDNSNLSEDILSKLFNFDIQIDQLKNTNISQGFLQEQSTGKLIEITVTVSMNDIDTLYNNTTKMGQELSFDYLLTVSKTTNY